MAEIWSVIRDRGNHWGMVEVEGPALTIKGFTQATDVDAVRAQKVEEDAHLIAAAPELMEALRIALKALDAIGNEMTVGERYTNAGQYLIDALEPARAALAKARGESNA